MVALRRSVTMSPLRVRPSSRHRRSNDHDSTRPAWTRIAAEARFDPARHRPQGYAADDRYIQSGGGRAARRRPGVPGARRLAGRSTGVILGSGPAGSLRSSTTCCSAARRSDLISVLHPGSAQCLLGSGRDRLRDARSELATGSPAHRRALDLEAWETIRRDDADSHLRLRTEACDPRGRRRWFASMKALSPRTRPEAASRPFDRAATVRIGEGAGSDTRERPTRRRAAPPARRARRLWRDGSNHTPCPPRRVGAVRAGQRARKAPWTGQIARHAHATSTTPRATGWSSFVEHAPASTRPASRHRTEFVLGHTSARGASNSPRRSSDPGGSGRRRSTRIADPNVTPTGPRTMRPTSRSGRVNNSSGRRPERRPCCRRWGLSTSGRLLLLGLITASQPA